MERPRVEHNDWVDGDAQRHASPVAPDDCALAALQQQLSDANKAKAQLEDELNSLRGNQSLALEEARNEVASTYQTQVSSLQQSLIQTEHSLQVLERQLSQAKAIHSSEVESIIREQEQLRDSLLQEKDQKHAAHVLRLTAELSTQEEFVTDRSQDLGEQEAERIRMIKESMKEMHEKKKQQLISEHKEEKVQLAEELRKQMESYTQQMEQVANAKVQEMHAQFMSAHQAMQEQKSIAEQEVVQWKAKLDEVEMQYESLAGEKHSLEEKYRSLLEVHSAEVEEIRSNARNLEERVNTWKEKAASLESHLKMSSQHQEKNFQKARAQLETELQVTVDEYKSKIRTLHSALEQEQQEKDSLKEQLLKAEEEIKLHYKGKIEEMKSQHGSEVELLEQSISEHSSDKASLEAAEEYMSSLQKQLEAFRMEKSNSNGRIAELQEQHTADLKLIRQRYEREKAEEVNAVQAQFVSQIEAMEKQLQDKEEAGQASSEAQAVLELMRNQTKLQEQHKLMMGSLRAELEAAHTEAMSHLRTQHEEETERLRAAFEQEWSTMFETDKAGIISELEKARDAEIKKIEVEHGKAVKKLEQSLVQKEKEAQDRVASMESELERLHKDEAEWKELQKDMMSQMEISQREIDEANVNLSKAVASESQLKQKCDTYEKRVRSIETDYHIVKSNNVQMQEVLKQTQEEASEWMAMVETLQNEISDLEAMECTNREHSQKLLEVTDQLAAKNVTIAELHEQNDTMNTEAFSLTQKCQQQIATIQMLQKQVENAGGINEETTSLQQQLSKLVPIKQHHDMLQEHVGQLEKALQAKDIDIVGLKSELEISAVRMKEMRAQWSAELKEITNSSVGEVEALKIEIASCGAQEKELRQTIQQQSAQLSHAESTSTAQDEVLVGMRNEVERLQGLLRDATTKSDQLQDRNRSLEEELQSFQEQLSYQQQSKDDVVSKLQDSYKQLQSSFAILTKEKDTLSAELTQLQEESGQRVDECSDSWREKVQQLEKELEDLHHQFRAKDLAFAEMQKDLTHQLTEAEMRENSLRQRLNHSQDDRALAGMSTGQKTVIEESLSRARRKLTEKLREKENLEKDLTFHRTELERRLGEKQRLEELLFEKTRFEQELLSQKEQLQNDLQGIESKLKVQMGIVEERDQLLKFKTREMEEKEKVHTAREEEIGQQHEHKVASLVASHNHQVFGLKQAHSGDISVLQSKHKKQVN